MLRGVACAESGPFVPGVHGAANADEGQFAVAAALHLGGDAAGASGRRPQSARLPPAERRRGRRRPAAADAAAVRRAHRARLLRLSAGALRGRRRRLRRPRHGRAHGLPRHRLLRHLGKIARHALCHKGEHQKFDFSLFSVVN